MHYTLHQLQIFQKIVEKRSITKAADELHLTQPAVSIQLKKFQEQFDIPLVEIIGRKLHVTDFGMQVSASAATILEEVYEIRNKTFSYKGLLSGQLKISVASTGKYVMPYFLEEFLSQHPGIELKMDVTNKSLVVNSLEQNDIDFALVSVLPENLDVHSIELMKNVLFLTRKKEGQKDSKVSVKLKDLSSIPLIYREQGSATRRAMEEFAAKSKIPVNKSIELTSNEAVKQAVLAGLGYSVTPLIGLKNELRNHQMEVVDCPGLPISTHWNLVWLKQKSLSPVAHAYGDYLSENKERLISEHFSWYESYLNAYKK